MHVWTMMSPKGGAGKTTLALVLAGEIARRGKHVTLIDADPNTPLALWAAQENKPDNIDVVVDDDPDGGQLAGLIKDARAQSEYVLIDTEGTANIRADRAVRRSHFVIVPCQSSTLDLREAGKAVRFIQECADDRGSEIPHVIVRTRMPPAIVDRNEKMISGRLTKSGFPVCMTQMVDRSAYRAMMSYGMTLDGLEPKHTAGLDKAREEADRLLHNIVGEYRGQVEVLMQREEQAKEAKANVG